ncbi:MAG: hypothetical protein K0Q48_1500 [Bacillota bacterium]|nr:hypothetical protein [Bacillota bacterium]
MNVLGLSFLDLSGTIISVFSVDRNETKKTNSNLFRYYRIGAVAADTINCYLEHFIQHYV